MQHRPQPWNWMLIASMACVAVLTLRPVWQVLTGPNTLKPGTVAPNFTAQSPQGQPISLADSHGQVVLVDFWATWCPPCVASMPGLERVYRAYRDRGLVVLGVNQEPDEAPRVRAFLQAKGITFPVVLDRGAIAKDYRVHSFPTSFLIGRDGVIHQMHRGAASEPGLRREIESLLQ